MNKINASKQVITLKTTPLNAEQLDEANESENSDDFNLGDETLESVRGP